MKKTTKKAKEAVPKKSGKKSKKAKKKSEALISFAELVLLPQRRLRVAGDRNGQHPYLKGTHRFLWVALNPAVPSPRCGGAFFVSCA